MVPSQRFLLLTHIHIVIFLYIFGLIKGLWHDASKSIQWSCAQHGYPGILGTRLEMAEGYCLDICPLFVDPILSWQQHILIVFRLRTLLIHLIVEVPKRWSSHNSSGTFIIKCFLVYLSLSSHVLTMTKPKSAVMESLGFSILELSSSLMTGKKCRTSVPAEHH